MTRIERGRETRRRSATRAWIWVALGAFALGAAGCSSISVHTDWDPQVDFTRLQTWRWSDESQTPTGDAALDTNGLLARRVMRSVEDVLGQKGYVKTSTNEGDFEVAWFLTVEPKTKVTTINDYHGYGPGWGGWYGAGYGGSTTVVDSYNEGTLIIDVKDGESGKLIWRGAGSARLRDKVDPEKAQQRAYEAVSQILAKFPPPSPKGG